MLRVSGAFLPATTKTPRERGFVGSDGLACAPVDYLHHLAKRTPNSRGRFVHTLW